MKARLDKNGKVKMFKDGVNSSDLNIGSFVKTTIESYADGGGLSRKKDAMSYFAFKKHYDKTETDNYNLKKAYEIYKSDPENFENDFANMQDDGWHFSTVDPSTGIFLKTKDHPTVGLEYDFYNSNEPGAAEFRNSFDLDTTDVYPRYVRREAPMFEEGGAAETSNSGSSDSSSKKTEDIPQSIQEKAQIAYDFIKSKKLKDGSVLDDNKTIAIIANLMAESKFDHSVSGDSGSAVGIAQWRKGRRDELEKKYGKNSTFLQQLEFLVDEYDGGSGGWLSLKGPGKMGTYYHYSKEEFDKADNYADATIMFAQGFERANKDYLRNDERVGFATAFHNSLVKKPAAEKANKFLMPSAQKKVPGTVAEELSKVGQYSSPSNLRIGVGSPNETFSDSGFTDYELDDPYGDFGNNVLDNVERLDGRINTTDDRIRNLTTLTEQQQDRIKTLEDSRRSATTVRDDGSYEVGEQTLSPEDKRQNEINFVLQMLGQMKLPEN